MVAVAVVLFDEEDDAADDFVVDVLLDCDVPLDDDPLVFVFPEFLWAVDFVEEDPDDFTDFVGLVVVAFAGPVPVVLPVCGAFTVAVVLVVLEEEEEEDDEGIGAVDNIRPA